MNPDRVTSFLCVAAAAVGAVGLYGLYRVLRRGAEITRSIREERRPKSQLDHAVLGRLTFCHGLFWSGERDHRGTRFSFFVNGNAEAPFPEAVSRLVAVLDDLDVTTEAAIDYLLATKDEDPLLPPQLTRKMCTLEDIMAPDENGDFDLHMALECEPNGSWLVQFKAGRPVYSGYED